MEKHTLNALISKISNGSSGSEGPINTPVSTTRSLSRESSRYLSDVGLVYKLLVAGVVGTGSLLLDHTEPAIIASQ